MEKLFTEFDPVTAQQWKDQLAKDLKGISFEQLTWHTDNGFDVKPFYAPGDAKQGKPLFRHSDWRIGERIVVDNEKEANFLAMEALNGGASCLKFCMAGDIDLAVLLDGIYIEHIAVEFELNSYVTEFESSFKNLLIERLLRSSDLQLTVNYDVLAHLAAQGTWLSDKENDLKDFTKASGLFFNTHKLLVDATLYQNAGASQVTELAMILSHYNEYLHHFNMQAFDMSLLKSGTQVNLSVGSDFFAEIAKLRALRELISLLHKAYSIEAPLFISCSTSHLTLSGRDAYTNLLRSTTQAMSAVIGGCSALYVTPFDALYEEGNEYFSARMARNQQLILKEESYLDKVADMGAGSYYIESLTENIASRAFDLFKAWEAQGGFIACLEKGIIQSLVKEQAAQLKAKAAAGELTVIGANKYINAKEAMPKLKAHPAAAKQPAIEPIEALRLAEAFEQEPSTAKH